MPEDFGIALSGGGALGAAHLGVLKRLEEVDIQPSHIAGTSIGALVGALRAFGWASDSITNFLQDLTWFEVSKLTASPLGALRNDPLGAKVKEALGDARIEDAATPLTIVATDIACGQAVHLRHGSVAQAVMASACLAGAYVPVTWGDQLLVDGALVENVPIEAIRKSGAHQVIAVDLLSTRRAARPENALEVLMNTLNFAVRGLSDRDQSSAAITIRPDLSSFHFLDVDHFDAVRQAGYDAALERWPKKATQTEA